MKFGGRALCVPLVKRRRPRTTVVEGTAVVALDEEGQVRLPSPTCSLRKGPCPRRRASKCARRLSTRSGARAIRSASSTTGPSRSPWQPTWITHTVHNDARGLHAVVYDAHGSGIVLYSPLPRN